MLLPHNLKHGNICISKIINYFMSDISQYEVITKKVKQ
jgi:hypothetical protein